MANAYPHIETYHEELARLIRFSGSDRESQIRSAFSRCLDDYCRSHHDKLALVEELPVNTRVIPDGTVKDSLRLARGYWEAKDTHDDLDREIQNKFNRGYPRDNIIFEDSRVAVLIQNGGEAMRVNMAESPELHRLITRFLDYELPEIEEFRAAQRQFSNDLPAVLDGLRQTIDEAAAANEEYRNKAAALLEHCRSTIGRDVSEADVREMLLQHILTKDIFLRVFAEDTFHRENTIAHALTELEETFFTGAIRRTSIERLRAYYGAIARAADTISDFQEKQTFLKVIYEDFYKAYNPKAADRLGIVYTPNEIVDFMIRGTDHLLRTHFGRSLADDNVEILDPATGTGTFITSLINYLPHDRLEYKYHHEIHANEVAILPYYIANLNIEYTYRERMGQYSEFPGLAFVDTLDNMDWQGGSSTTRQPNLNVGGMSVDNWIRVQEQNERKISVIIGNPPYNDSQQNANDLNPNRKYPAIDKRIRDTYVKQSKAQRSHQYDMYKRFIRWASDRLADDGIVAFITNRSYIDSHNDDGYRKIALDEFDHVYVVDLGGDVRKNGSVGNVFGIMTGVAIGFLVRERQGTGHRAQGTGQLYYAGISDAMSGDEKLTTLKRLEAPRIEWDRITPDAKSNWLNQTDSDFESLLPVANRETKNAKRQADESAIFGLYSLGITTHRDEWAYDLNQLHLASKVRHFANVYNRELARYQIERPERSGLSLWVDRSIKWTSELEDHIARGNPLDFSMESVTKSLYRPYVHKATYFAPIFTHRRYQQQSIFPYQGGANLVICFRDVSNPAPFHSLAVDSLPNLHLTGDTQTLPLYRYREDGTRVSNITEWGLRQFRGHYGDESITPEQIFAYTYAALHDPVYREKYAIDLTREFPRLPFHDDFQAWAAFGQELLDLHIGFESVEPHPLRRVDAASTGRDTDGAPKARLRANKERGIIELDERTSLHNVPAGVWDYRLGNRSAVEWILDQYKEKTPRDPTIREHFNTYRFTDYKERVIDLLQRVTTVSLRTNEIVALLGETSGVTPAD